MISALIELTDNFKMLSAQFLFQLYAFTSMAVVILSTVVFILSTMPEVYFAIFTTTATPPTNIIFQLTDDLDLLLFTNASNGSNLIDFAEQPVERWEEVSFLRKEYFGIH